MEQCDICMEMGCDDCMNCYLGNPCLGCKDYDKEKEECASNGACGERKEEQ